MFTQCWINVGPPSTTPNINPTSLLGRVRIHRSFLFNLQSTSLLEVLPMQDQFKVIFDVIITVLREPLTLLPLSYLL